MRTLGRGRGPGGGGAGFEAVGEEGAVGDRQIVRTTRVMLPSTSRTLTRRSRFQSSGRGAASGICQIRSLAGRRSGRDRRVERSRGGRPGGSRRARRASRDRSRSRRRRGRNESPESLPLGIRAGTWAPGRSPGSGMPSRHPARHPAVPAGKTCPVEAADDADFPEDGWLGSVPADRRHADAGRQARRSLPGHHHRPP